MFEKALAYEPIPRFSNEIDLILSKKVTAQNIDSFAEDALDELIDTISRVVGYYEHNPTLKMSSQKEMEMTSLSYSGLDPIFIDHALDRIADVVDGIKQLEVLIDERTIIVDTVIVPPDVIDTDIEAADGSQREGQEFDKLKLILLLLKEQCGITISDSTQLMITSGTNTPQMYRKLSYQLVQVPSLQRDILVCNEYGNTTFVFDTTKYEAQHIESHTLIGMSKVQLKQLQQIDDIGTVINYSDAYAERLLEAIENPISQKESVTKNSRFIDILRPQQAPTDYLTITGLAKKLDTSHRIIAATVDSLREDLGEAVIYPSRGGATEFFSTEQQALIEQELPEKAPEGYMTWKSMADTIGMYRSSLIKIVEKSGISLGELRVYGSNAGVSEYLSPEQQDIITEIIPAIAPESYVTIKTLSLKVHASRALVSRIIQKNNDALGEVGVFRSPGPTGLAQYFSPHQQEIVIELLRNQSPLPPEDNKTAEAIAKVKGVDASSIKRIVDEYSEEIGVVKEYRSNFGLSVYYSPKQQAVIESYILAVAPEGDRTLEALARITKISVHVLQRTIRNNQAEIGYGSKYRAGGRSGHAEFYSPSQQDHIERLAPQVPPEGYLTLRGVCQKYSLTQYNVVQAINKLNKEIGIVGSHVSKSNTGQSDYYSPEQQEMIVNYFKRIDD